MNKLIFITSKFPFGNGETFIENEIDYLAKSFDKVYIYAVEAVGNEPKRKVPKNVTVFAANPKTVTKKDYIPCLFNWLNIKEIFTHCLSKNAFAKISACCYFLAETKESSKNITGFLKECEIQSSDMITVYSYWLSTIGMCAVNIHKKLEKMHVKANLVSRCHGFDIYEYRSFISYLPFQEYIVKKMDNLFPCSKDGEEYLKEKYPSQSAKITTEYLGVADRFNTKIPERKEIFNIVSCSNIIPVKRVNLIVEALSKITDKKILWTHFGDGEEFEKIKNLAKNILSENIKCNFYGRITNTEIYDYYNNNDVNLFLNVSSSEGLPVSIMEAISFGVPVIATDVGGTTEILNDRKNGILLKKDFQIEELRNAICKIVDMPNEEYKELCDGSRKTYESNFVAQKNYKKFCETIKSV